MPTPNSLDDLSIKRTNVRLPARLHEALKRASLTRHRSIEDIIQTALERELTLVDATASGTLSHNQRNTILSALANLETSVNQIAGALAPANESAEQFIRAVGFRLLQTAPLSALITEMDGRVKWCNHACELLFGASVAALKGQPIELVQKLRAMADMRAWEAGRSSTTEALIVNGVTKRFLVHRFVFSTPREACIGSLAFSVDEIEAAQKADVVLQSLPQTDLGEHPNLETIELIAAFMEHLPTPAVIRDRTLRTLWCNHQYLVVSGEETKETVLGKQIEETFPRLNTAGVKNLDEKILIEGKPMLTALRMPDSTVRTNLRFPIFDVTAQILYIAAVGSSTETFSS